MVRRWWVLMLLAAAVVSCSDGESTGLRVIPDDEWEATWSSTIVEDDGHLYVVNRDNGSITAVSEAEQSALWEVDVGERPRTIAADPRGGRLLVATSGRLALLDRSDGHQVAEAPAGRTPFGVIVSPDGTTVVVSEEDAGTVAFYNNSDGDALERVAELTVGDRPRGLAMTADGSTLLVSHYLTGEVTVVDLGSRTVVDTISTGTKSNIAQHIALAPSGDRAYVPHTLSLDSNPDLTFETTIAPLVSAIDLDARQVVGDETLGLATFDAHLSVNLPLAIDFTPDGNTMFVMNSGSNDISIIDLSRGFGVGRGTIEVGDNPEGLVVSDDGTTLYVHNRLSQDLSVIDVETLAPSARIPITIPAASEDVLAGERLFFSSDSSGLAMYQWISCASCHLEGGHDGRTWFFESGPRNTPALHAMDETAPFHWAGERPTLLDFQETIQELQGGTGLSKDKLQQLADFMATLEVPDSPFVEPDGGREVFEALGCATCHAGDAFVDGQQHDVGSGEDPSELLGPEFDTPTLHGLWNSAPYYHDGSMPSLADIFAPGRSDDPHSIDLPPQDLRLLLDYLNAQ